MSSNIIGSSRNVYSKSMETIKDADKDVSKITNKMIDKLSSSTKGMTTIIEEKCNVNLNKLCENVPQKLQYVPIVVAARGLAIGAMIVGKQIKELSGNKSDPAVDHEIPSRTATRRNAFSSPSDKNVKFADEPGDTPSTQETAARPPTQSPTFSLQNARKRLKSIIDPSDRKEKLPENPIQTSPEQDLQIRAIEVNRAASKLFNARDALNDVKHYSPNDQEKIEEAEIKVQQEEINYQAFRNEYEEKNIEKPIVETYEPPVVDNAAMTLAYSKLRDAREYLEDIKTYSRSPNKAEEIAAAEEQLRFAEQEYNVATMGTQQKIEPKK